MWLMVFPTKKLILAKMDIRKWHKLPFANKEKYEIEHASHPDGPGMKLHGINGDVDVIANISFSQEQST